MFTTSTNLATLTSGSPAATHRVLRLDLGVRLDLALRAADPGTADADAADPPAVRATAARCRDGNGTLTHLFFSDDLFDIARAKAICRRCSQADACLQGALARAEPWGVWGGELLLDGAVVAHKRPRGRPPKHPRPELVVDEVPVPPKIA